MSVVLANGTLASLASREIIDGPIVIDDGRITQVGGDAPTGAEIVDCSGMMIMPGNACAHTHLYSSLARGMPAPTRAPTNFPEILERIWWRLDRALDDRSIEYSALAGALDAVRSGTTTLFDHHASPNFIDGSLDILAGALERIGCRSVLCYEVTDRGGKQRRDAGLRENERFLKSAGGLSRGMVGAHASFTLDDDSLEKIAGLVADSGAGVHIHVAEDVCDESDSLERSGKRTAIRLADAGVLTDSSIAAHGVHLRESEIETLEGIGACLAHNCRSNMNNSVGRARVACFGSRIALGTDGIDGDMFAESQAAYFRAREDSLDVGAERFTDMLARGADLASKPFGLPIGVLERGAAADLMLLDYRPPTPISGSNLAWHWMFGLSAANIRHVMVGGRWILRDGKFTAIDEEKIRQEAASEARALWNRMDDIK